MEHHNIMAARTQIAQVRFQPVNRRKQVGNQHDQAAPCQHPGNVLQRWTQVGGTAFRGSLQRQHQAAQITRPVARRQILPELIVECRQADSVTLSEKKIS
ncbi:hypothetical protein ES703_74314 [subsurface metagenome]